MILLPPHRNRRGGRQFIALAVCLLTFATSGCKETFDSEESTPGTAFFITLSQINTKTKTDISPYVSGNLDSRPSLSQVRSVDHRCEFNVEEQLTFSTLSQDEGLCLLEYTVSNGQQSSTENAISVNSSNGEIRFLPQLYRNIHLDDGPDTVDILHELEVITGDDYSQHVVMPDTAVIGSGSAVINNNDLTFTPSGYGNITVYYTVQNNSEIALGSLNFAVSDSNQAPAAQDVTYPTIIKYEDKLTIDIAALKDGSGNPIVSSPDGDQLYLTNVISLESRTALSTATKPLSFTLYVPYGATQKQDLTYVVSDKKGGYASGIIRFEMEPLPPSFILNDTGVDWCTTSTGDDSLLDCNLPSHNNLPIPKPQDGHVGRDALAREGKLNKKGGGPAGFDFTKIDSKGDELPESTPNWSCVKDNNTGRIWEVKTRDGTIHDIDQSFTWFNSNPKQNGGDPGVENGGNCNGGAICDTEKFIQHLNTIEFCGQQDWRLPSVSEFLSIVNFGQQIPNVSSYLPPEYFHDHYNPVVGKFYLWLSESKVGTNQAMYSSVSDPTIYPSLKDRSRGIMATAGRPYSDFDRPDRFIFHPDNTVTDTITKLMWTRCLTGQIWDGTDCVGTSARLFWYEHVETATKSNLGGHSDWRIPSVKELDSLRDTTPAVRYGQIVPPKSFFTFPVNSTIGMITATPYPMTRSFMFAVSTDGSVSWMPKYNRTPALYCRDVK
ncbi:TPA: DUF1566 domain-containing protein [Vibrio vulnificus]